MTTPVRHLLVTNDFPPKIGGIQSVLWESWRRLDPDSFAVLTSPHPDAAAFDAEQPFRVERVREFALLPHPVMVRRIRRLAAEFGAQRVVLDPVFPLGLVGPRLGLPYDVVVHGAELTIPGRLPVTSHLIRSVLTGARRVIAFGTYPAAVSRAVARADLDVAIINPGVDTDRFRPLDPAGRAAARARLGLDPSAQVVLGISRLVRRKGFDTAIAAVGRLAPDFERLELVIAGAGRDEERLRALAARCGAPVRFLGRVPDADLADLYAVADLQVMLCRDRWWGLEQEGFGIVFVEAAAAHHNWPGAAADRPTPWSTGSPASSSSGPRRSTMSQRRWPICFGAPTVSPRWGSPRAGAPRPSSPTNGWPADSARPSATDRSPEPWRGRRRRTASWVNGCDR